MDNVIILNQFCCSSRKSSGVNIGEDPKGLEKLLIPPVSVESVAGTKKVLPFLLTISSLPSSSMSNRSLGNNLAKSTYSPFSILCLIYSST